MYTCVNGKNITQDLAPVDDTKGGQITLPINGAYIIYYGAEDDIKNVCSSLSPKRIEGKDVLDITNLVKALNGNLPAQIWTVIGDPAFGKAKTLVVHYNGNFKREPYGNPVTDKAINIPRPEIIKSVYYGETTQVRAQ